ncbi:SMI1/KNR4 family protein [Actinomadura rifamycini]|uniref:SMI1/KNR4 family protein n=1 Tax=Actinomadura rifamycini TaxID=31962 RepID=UPI00040D12B0|nr:SMI1/KNR4 family protein [Actinomadura rifamycini]
MTELERLLALVPPPPSPAETDWTRAEEALGLALPPEFTAIVRRYGPGTFCDEFSLWSPEKAIEENPGRLEDLRLMLGHCPHPVHPEPGGLVAWGSDSVGGTLAWLTDPAGSPRHWKTVYWTRDDDFEYPDGGVAAVLTALIERRTASMRDRGADVDGPWFDPRRSDVHVYLRLAEADGAPPYEERLRILRRSLAPTRARGGFANGGARQDHFATADGRWKLTYETAYGHQIRVAYPPAADAQVRGALLPAIEAMGCRIDAVVPVHGTVHWPEPA